MATDHPNPGVAEPGATYEGAAATVGALSRQVAALAEQVDSLKAAVARAPGSAEQPWWRKADGVGSVLGATLSLLTLGVLFLTAAGMEKRMDGVDKRLDGVQDEIHRLDDRLTPAIKDLTGAVAALDKREAVDQAKRR